MGCYDTIYDVDLECPYCGSGIFLELQTKALGRNLRHYYVFSDKERKDASVRVEAFAGARVPEEDVGRVNFIDAIADCSSPFCMFVARVNQLCVMDYTTGAGRFFRLRYKVDKKGFLVGSSAKVIEKDTHTIDGAKSDLSNYFLVNPVYHEKFLKNFGKYRDTALTVLMTPFVHLSDDEDPFWGTEEKIKKEKC